MTDTESPDPNIPPPVKYGSFNNRMIASTIDVCVLVTLAMPAVEYMVRQMFPPLDMARFVSILQAPELREDTTKLVATLWAAMFEQRVPQRMVVQNLLQLGFISMYILPCWFRYSTSLGKMLFRLQIVDEKTGERMSDKQAILRFLGYFVSGMMFTLGFVWILFDKKKRGFHDRIAGTVVIVKPKKPRVPPAPPVEIQPPAPSA
jgi:uncharacterized RDD family membrane protein YckC